MIEGGSGLLYTLYISRGVDFREFRKSGAIREINNTLKYSLQFQIYDTINTLVSYKCRTVY